MPICSPSRPCYSAYHQRRAAANRPTRSQSTSAYSSRHTTGGGQQRHRSHGRLHPTSAAQLEELEASIPSAKATGLQDSSSHPGGAGTAPLQQDWELEIEELQKLVSLLPSSVRSAVEEHPEMTQLLEVRAHGADGSAPPDPTPCMGHGGSGPRYRSSHACGWSRTCPPH